MGCEPLNVGGPGADLARMGASWQRRRKARQTGRLSDHRTYEFVAHCENSPSVFLCLLAFVNTALTARPDGR